MIFYSISVQATGVTTGTGEKVAEFSGTYSSSESLISYAGRGSGNRGVLGLLEPRMDAYSDKNMEGTKEKEAVVSIIEGVRELTTYGWVIEGKLSSSILASFRLGNSDRTFRRRIQTIQATTDASTTPFALDSPLLRLLCYVSSHLRILKF